MGEERLELALVDAREQLRVPDQHQRHRAIEIQRLGPPCGALEAGDQLPSRALVEVELPGVALAQELQRASPAAAPGRGGRSGTRLRGGGRRERVAARLGRAVDAVQAREGRQPGCSQ